MSEKKYISIPASSQLHGELVKVCQKNMWIKENGATFADDPFLEADCPYSFARVECIDNLKDVFEEGCWSARQGFLYNDLLFVNQVNGGDEWWTLKYDRSKCKYVAFESVTFRRIIEDGEFYEYINRLENATIEDLVSLNY